MKAEPLVTRALEDAIAYCDLMGRADATLPPILVKIWPLRAAEYRRLLAKLKPAKSVQKRGRR